MAYAGRLFLKMISETGKLGRIAFKPTQAMEDGINAGIITWLLEGTKFKIGRKMHILATIIKGKKGQHKSIIEEIKKDGFLRLRVDGEILSINDLSLIHI